MLYNTIKFKGKQINYRCQGQEEETLVLLHGLMNNLSVWDNFFKFYKGKIKLVAIDLLGHGESELVEAVSSMELQAEMVKEVLDRLKITKCVMVGHSMGGMITMCFAEKYPEYLNGYCLLHSSALADNPKGQENRKRACKIVNEDKLKYIVDFIPNLFARENVDKFSEEIQQLKDIALSTSKESIIASQLGMIERKDRRDVLEKSNVPVLFIVGKQDVRSDVFSILALSSLPNFAETLLLNCGHMSFIEEEKVIKLKLLSFVHLCFEIQ